jgi:hypothetical protein
MDLTAWLFTTAASKMTLATGYMLFLAARGLGSRVGFASWHMFVAAERCEFHLSYAEMDGCRRDLNPWDYLPHSALAMNRAGAELFLFYLEHTHGLRLDGRLDLHGPEGTVTLAVEDSRVIAR